MKAIDSDIHLKSQGEEVVLEVLKDRKQVGPVNSSLGAKPQRDTSKSPKEPLRVRSSASIYLHPSQLIMLCASEYSTTDLV
jgi:hypothetical protein